MQQQRTVRDPHTVAQRAQRGNFRRYDALRRTLDVLVAVTGLVLLAPLFVLVALAIRLDSPGPVFYSQARVGRDRRRRDSSLWLFGNVFRLDLRRDNEGGRVFRMIKFRTMRQDAEAVTGPVWAQENDPRVTRIGRHLRQTRLDELPQLWNVLKGEMTIVGPRPERPELVREFNEQIAGYAHRHLVTPGITGLAQIRQGYDRCLDDVKSKLAHDLEYIEYRSLWLDLYICLATIGVMAFGRGAR